MTILKRTFIRHIMIQKYVAQAMEEIKVHFIIVAFKACLSLAHTDLMGWQ